MHKDKVFRTPLRAGVHLLALFATVARPACRGGQEPRATESSGGEVAPSGLDETVEPAPEPKPLPAGLAPFVKPWTGDLDGMVERRVVRVLTVQSPVLYFVDRGRELGLTYETVMGFEKHLNETLGTGHMQV